MCKINGKKLEELRVQAGMTKAELAKMLGVSGQTITNYENGKSSPSDENAKKICMILKISKDDIEIHDVGYSFTNGESKTVCAARRRKGFKRYTSPTFTEEWIQNRNKLNGAKELEEVENALAFSSVFAGKKYIQVNPTVIHVPEWQRDTDMAKVTEIAENFSEDKYDPIKAYLTEDGKLMVADGAHRVIAFIKNRKTKILVEVLNCSEHEAVLTFLGQQSGRKTMTVNDTYRAGVKANIKDYLDFKELFESYHIQITAEETDLDNAIGEVRPSMSLLRMVHNDPERLKRIIKVIQQLEWYGSEKEVFTLRNFSVLKKILTNIPNAEEKLKKHCKGAAFYESRVFPVKSNAEMYDMLCTEMNK